MKKLSLTDENGIIIRKKKKMKKASLSKRMKNLLFQKDGMGIFLVRKYCQTVKR